jgi:hypothetical protein
MAAITQTAEQFFKACETGQGWDGCSGFCTPDATFVAQAEPLAGIKSLREYTEWMRGLLTFMPDGRYGRATPERLRLWSLHRYPHWTGRTATADR